MKTFVAPPFDPGSYETPTFSYYWWSWHPNYPYWSKSCWGGATYNEAVVAIRSPLAVGMKVYHNKLIFESEGKFIEVADLPANYEGFWGKIG